MARFKIEEYPDNWNEIARKIKDEAGWKCIRCGHIHEVETGYVLTVHHLDGMKSNCEWWNLVALCQRCHLKIQVKVVMGNPWMFEHSEWFKPYVAGYYAFINGYRHDRPFVEKYIQELLELGKPKTTQDENSLLDYLDK